MIAAFYVLVGGTVLVADTFFVIDESDTIYSKGVHAFFDRNYKEAVTILLDAEKLESNDPRPYYFLGLAYLRQEKSKQADQYFEKAAKLEYSGRAARDYAVSESLRRIQGEERLWIEKIRATERTNAQKREQRLQEMRYGKENTAVRESLRQQLSPQNQNEDLAILKKMVEGIDANAFGAKPINPVDTSEEIIAKRKSETNPFDEIIVTPVSTLPETIETQPTPDRSRRTPTDRRRSIAESQPVSNVSPARRTQATAAKELGRGLRALFSNRVNEEKTVPTVTTLEPANGATDVDPGMVTELRVTFDVDMNMDNYSWCGSGETYPKTTGEPKWIDERTCVLPVELESGKNYLLGINAPSFKGFQSKDGIPVQPLLYKFSTQ